MANNNLSQYFNLNGLVGSSEDFNKARQLTTFLEDLANPSTKVVTRSISTLTPETYINYWLTNPTIGGTASSRMTLKLPDGSELQSPYLEGLQNSNLTQSQKALIEENWRNAVDYKHSQEYYRTNPETGGFEHPTVDFDDMLQANPQYTTPYGADEVITSSADDAAAAVPKIVEPQVKPTVVEPQVNKVVAETADDAAAAVSKGLNSAVTDDVAKGLAGTANTVVAETADDALVASMKNGGYLTGTNAQGVTKSVIELPGGSKSVAYIDKNGNIISSGLGAIDDATGNIKINTYIPNAAPANVSTSAGSIHIDSLGTTELKAVLGEDAIDLSLGGSTNSGVLTTRSGKTYKIETVGNSGVENGYILTPDAADDVAAGLSNSADDVAGAVANSADDVAGAVAGAAKSGSGAFKQAAGKVAGKVAKVLSSDLVQKASNVLMAEQIGEQAINFGDQAHREGAMYTLNKDYGIEYIKPEQKLSDMLNPFASTPSPKLKMNPETDYAALYKQAFNAGEDKYVLNAIQDLRDEKVRVGEANDITYTNTLGEPVKELHPIQEKEDKRNFLQKWFDGTTVGQAVNLLTKPNNSGSMDLYHELENEESRKQNGVTAATAPTTGRYKSNIVAPRGH